MSSDRTRLNRHKLKHRRFLVNMKKHFFTVRVSEHWHRLPRDVLDSLSLEMEQPGCGPVQPTLVALLEPRRWTR